MSKPVEHDPGAPMIVKDPTSEKESASANALKKQNEDDQARGGSQFMDADAPEGGEPVVEVVTKPETTPAEKPAPQPPTAQKGKKK